MLLSPGEILDYCKRCKEFNEDLECQVFEDLYPLWGEGPCPARKLDTSEEITSEEARAMFFEEMNRDIKKHQSKSGQDHPIFTKQRMKDNRKIRPYARWDRFVEFREKMKELDEKAEE